MQKLASTSVPIQETITKRWSARAYDATKSVSQQQIIALLEAARWAPSSYGDQPWRIMVFDKTTNPQAWQAAFDCLLPNNQVWAKDAPVLLLGCANTVLEYNGDANRFGQYDTGAAIENLCLQATHLGLMTHQMGGFKSDLAREKFNIPAQFTPMAMLAVGYEGDANNLPEDLKARELAERKRKPLGELFFDGIWDKPIKAK
jgi:nitroreductase